MLDQWKKAQDKTYLSSLSIGTNGDGAELWVKHAINIIRLNVDAALFQEDQSYGFGIVARDASGKVLEAISVYHGGIYPAETIEAMGVKEALSWVKRNSWEDVEVETDSMFTVQAIRNNHTMSSVFGLIVKDLSVFTFLFKKC
uniref:RNase H type-1 domain-containing protein n=1 Tax=Cannabis sativa TaxID=3483 RepID=A0A803PVI4_CANSA